jgi:predicted patatin/cPLA2 family phospholipase
MHPVISALYDRQRSSSVPTKRDDKYKIGLVVEGGSMRGVVSAGMLTALEALGLGNAFDVVYGTSAGAINGAFFLARQAAFGTTIYYENINNRFFIDVARIFRGMPPVLLDYVFDTVLVKEKVLDWKAVTESPVPLKVLASSVAECRSVVLEGFHSRDDLFTALKASSSMPGVTGPPVAYRGDRFFDGSVYASIPSEAAEREGCTHILALLTRPLDCRMPRTSRIDRYYVSPWLRRFSSVMSQDVLRQKSVYCDQLAALKQRSETANAPPYVCMVASPEGSAEVGRMEKDRSRLVQGAKDGMKAMLRFFVTPATVHELLTPIDFLGRNIKLMC